MKRKPEKSKWFKFFSFFNFTNFLSFLAILLVLFLIYPTYRESLEQKKVLNEMKQKLLKLKRENKALEEELARLKTTSTIEELARKDLGLIKPGEKAYIVVPPEKANQTLGGGEEKPKEVKKKSFWQRVVDFFKNLF